MLGYFIGAFALFLQNKHPYHNESRLIFRRPYNNQLPSRTLADRHHKHDSRVGLFLSQGFKRRLFFQAIRQHGALSLKSSIDTTFFLYLSDQTQCFFHRHGNAVAGIQSYHYKAYVPPTA